MLQKQSLNINFAEGLDTKTDPFQVQPGKFLSLQNSIFTKAGQLTKRNGYEALASLPDNTSKYVTTFNGDLTAIGNSLQAYSSSLNTWVDKGLLQPISLNTLSLVKSNTNQSQVDAASAPNGLICTVFTDNVSGSPVYKYVIADSTTGQNIIEPTAIPAVSGGVVTGSPRVFILGTFFVILFTNHISSAYHLQYLAISYNNPGYSAPIADITASYIPTANLSFDAVSVNSSLYVAYNTTAGGQSVAITALGTNFVLQTPTVYTGQKATSMSVTADVTNPAAPIIYATYYDSSSTNGWTLAVDKNFHAILAPTQIITGVAVANITSSALNGAVEAIYEVTNAYGYDGSIATNFLAGVSCTQTGTVGTPSVILRSLGLASKSFIVDGAIYCLALYESAYQPTYFLIKQGGLILAKLAYSNGPKSYYTVGLPSVTVNGEIASVPYFYADLVQAVNKSMGVASNTGVYAQTGINLVSFNLDYPTIVTAEIGTNLNLSGGFLSMYDGYNISEQGFFLYPDYVELLPESTGSMTAQQYFYQVTYEWADNQGNLFRSSPSLPVSITLAGGQTSVTLNIPTLRLTYKIANPVKIVIYRWSAAQEVFYQTTSITSPIMNNVTVDYIQYTDTLADADILGNNIIYTTGGVLEDVSPAATDIVTLFNNRLWMVDSENRNLLWFSKQVLSNTPVEMSDLLTLFVAPTTAAQGSTGFITALGPMDDKLIVFKANALGYINGIGPDNTGSNNQYSDFTLINSVVGCTNQSSIVFTPQGLMFQSDKGIWLVDRSLGTNYIGAPVEGLTTGALVQSAVNVPGTNQVRFTLDTGITLMYDYYYGQWGTFTNVPAISSTLYESLHTYINSLGQVFQETPGTYLDNTAPVLMSFTTSWISMAGIQGYERFYSMFMLGQYITPFRLNMQLAYNYNSSQVQATIVTPQAPSGAWGTAPLWGSGSPWGGPSKVFEARLFPLVQKCETFQVTMNELYDPSYGIAAGAGLTLSGLNLVIGMKKGRRVSSAGRNFG